MITISLITVTYKLFQFSIRTQQEEHIKRYVLCTPNVVGFDSVKKKVGMICTFVSQCENKNRRFFFVQVFHTQIPIGRK